MNYSKKLFVSVAVALCISFVIGTISHAKIAQYEEINYGYPFGKDFIPTDFSMCIDSSGRLSINSDNMWMYKFITYNSKKKKTVKLYKYYGDEGGPEAVYGNRAYSIGAKDRLIVFTIKRNIIKKKPIKKIDLNKVMKKYFNKDEDTISLFKILGITKKNIVRIRYLEKRNVTNSSYYGGIIDLNTVTGKAKMVISPDEFYPDYYDGKNIYGSESKDGKITFYRMSIKSKRIEQFTVDEFEYEVKNYPNSVLAPYFYNGQIMAICPSGKVYYGTFASKKFELVGKISKGEHFNKYAALDFAMKSKKEFYIAYGTRAKRSKEIDSSIYGKIFVDKYTCK